MEQQILFGFPCISWQLQNLRDISIKTCREKTFKEKGLSYVGDLASDNLSYTLNALIWSYEQKLRAYRISADIFPWISEYNIEDYAGGTKILIQNRLFQISKYIQEKNFYIEYHVSEYCVPASNKKEVRQKAIKEINFAGWLFHQLNLDPKKSTITFHLGSSCNDKNIAYQMFEETYNQLDENTRKFLSVEIDDRPKLFNVHELYDNIFLKYHIPIVFDSLHHKCNSHGTFNEVLDKCLSTWKEFDRTPFIHISDSKKIEDNLAKETSHADFIYENPGFKHDEGVFIFELKMKDLAIKKYCKNLQINL